MQKGEAARGRRAALPIPTLTARRHALPRMLPIIEKHEPVPSDDGTMLVTLSDGRREWSVRRCRAAPRPPSVTACTVRRGRAASTCSGGRQTTSPRTARRRGDGGRCAELRHLRARAEGDAGARDAVVEEGEARDQVAAREVDVGAGVVRRSPRRRRRAAPPRDPARAHRPRRAHGGGARRRPRRRRRRRRRPRLRPRRLRRDHGRADRAAALPRRALVDDVCELPGAAGPIGGFGGVAPYAVGKRGLGRVRRRPPPPSSFEDLVGLDLCIGGAAARGVEPAAVVEPPRSSPAPDEIPPPVAWPPAGASGGARRATCAGAWRRRFNARRRPGTRRCPRHSSTPWRRRRLAWDTTAR